MGYKVQFPIGPFLVVSSISDKEDSLFLTAVVKNKSTGEEFTLHKSSEVEFNKAVQQYIQTKILETENVNSVEYPYSFLFNLAVELLIEGLPNANQCKLYKWHCDRGYGKLYVSDDQYALYLAQVANRSVREKRSRPKPVDYEGAESEPVVTKLKRKKGKKLRSANEKSEKSSKKIAAATTTVSDSAKGGSSRGRENKKWLEQLRSLYKKETLLELKKARADAATSIFDRYYAEADKKVDIELLESALYQYLNGAGSALSSSSSSIGLNEFIESLPTVSRSFGNSDLMFDYDVFDNILNIVNRAHVFRNHLKLHAPLSVDRLIHILKLKSSRPKVELTIETKTLIAPLELEKDACCVENLDMEIVDNGHSNAATAQMQNDVDFERLILCLVRGAYPQLHQLLGLAARNEELFREQSNSITGLKGDINLHEDASSSCVGNVHFPLNELTWKEIARLSLVTSLCTEMDAVGISTPATDRVDELLHLLKGSRLNQYISTRNLMRFYRHKVAFKSIVDVNWSKLCNSYYSNVAAKIGSYSSVSVNKHSYESMDELKNSVINVINDSSCEEVYRRCACVLMKLLKLKESASFVWEIDSSLFPEYYQIVKTPIAFCHIASKLSNRDYSSSSNGNESKDSFYINVARQFNDDIQLLARNCFVYNTESVAETASAYKLLNAFRRHMEQWVWGQVPFRDACQTAGPILPAIQVCNDNYCFYSHECIDIECQEAKQQQVSCSFCSAKFRKHLFTDCSVPTEVEVVNNVLPQIHALQTACKYLSNNSSIANDDWFCMYCLVESDESNSSRNQSLLGPNMSMPMCLNTNYSLKAKMFLDPSSCDESLQSQMDSPDERLLKQFVTANPFARKSSFMHLLKMHSSLSTLLDQEGLIEVPNFISILGGITEMLLLQPGVQHLLSKQFQACNKLKQACAVYSNHRVTIENKTSNFLDLAKELGGGEAGKLCNLLLGNVATEEKLLLPKLFEDVDQHRDKQLEDFLIDSNIIRKSAKQLKSKSSRGNSFVFVSFWCCNM